MNQLAIINIRELLKTSPDHLIFAKNQDFYVKSLIFRSSHNNKNQLIESKEVETDYPTKRSEKLKVKTTTITYIYDKKGNKISEKSAGSSQHKFEYKYDEDDILSERIEYDKQGKKVQLIKYIYE